MTASAAIEIQKPFLKTTPSVATTPENSLSDALRPVGSA